GHPGKFELADGGTIFLDEIGELPLDTQSKLLRVLDNGKVIRVGDTYEKQLDVRIIGATNRILKNEIAIKNFREDLYYRLNVVEIDLPPLRERKEDILLLVNKFIKEICEENNREPLKISKEAMDILQRYTWKGNIRELKNTIEN
ncbi:sigma 54-interacting transcriptional regulator, partial [Lawsonibacter sp. DFI.5.51]|nr:sigma 54-interacting transcriptional regulator [Lawsonibacter sp. DFI.5.51]